MKTEVGTLSGKALIWAVCEALGQSPVLDGAEVAYRSEHGAWVQPHYTEDAEAGVLIAAEWISVERPSKAQTKPQWRAVTENKAPQDPYRFNPVVSAYGDTLGIAVCRALVRSRLGNTVDIPNTILNLEAA